MPERAHGQSAMIFDLPRVIALFADCGSRLGSPEDVIRWLSAYFLWIRIRPASKTCRRPSASLMAVRPYIRTFDSNDYWASTGVEGNMLGCSLVERLSVRRHARVKNCTGAHLAFTLPKGGLEYHLQRFLIPGRRPLRTPAAQF